MKTKAELDDYVDKQMIERLSIAVKQLVPFGFTQIQQKVLNEVLIELGRSCFSDGLQLAIVALEKKAKEE